MVLGVWNCFIAAHFEINGWILLTEIVYPKNSTDLAAKLYFFFFTINPSCRSLYNTMSKYFQCSSKVRE